MSEQIRQRRESLKGKVLPGMFFGFLKVLRRAKNVEHGRHVWWWCQCICKREIVVRQEKLARGKKTSCGCNKGKPAPEVPNKHRYSLTPEEEQERRRRTKAREAWHGMRHRCCNPKHPGYALYGGKGIWVCENYKHSYDEFLKDVGLPPEKEFTLDRISNRLGYCCGRCDDCKVRGVPMNIRWASKQEQARNRSCVRMIEFSGVTMTLAEWSRKTGISPATIRWRLENGFPIEQVFFGGRFIQRRQKDCLPLTGMLSEFWR